MIILGIIIGLLIGIMVFTILTFFRAGIEKRVKIIETQIAKYGPKPKGHIFIPPSENDEFIEEYVSKKQSKGERTTLSELIIE